MNLEYDILVPASFALIIATIIYIIYKYNKNKRLRINENSKLDNNKTSTIEEGRSLVDILYNKNESFESYKNYYAKHRKE